VTLENSAPRFIEKAHLPTEHGNFVMYTFDSGIPDFPHVALVSGNQTEQIAPLIRIHSECMTGDVFGSQRCDCGAQLHSAMDRIGREGGAVIYLRQEGRGIGLVNKLKAYNLQDEGMDTVEANLALGFHADDRDYEPAIQILKFLGISRVRIMTNNPDKLKSFEGSGIELCDRLPIVIAPVNASKAYLETKRLRMGHLPD
jgi:3,4-dihydroxy 2-butanone 4-phosphate synthase / GTP cyclohydrolase II